MAFPKIEMPDHFEIDDSMIIPPLAPEARARITISRGPNIGEPPVNRPMTNDIIGQVTIKVGDLVTTDHIMPAGSRLKYRSNVPKYSEFVFEPLDKEFSSRAMALRDRGIHNLIVAGTSYGQGSSREHAALCPMYLGVKAVVAKSIERIHAANLVNFGIVPLSFVQKTDYDALAAGEEIRIPGIRTALQQDSDSVVAFSGGRQICLKMSLPDAREIFCWQEGFCPTQCREEKLSRSAAMGRTALLFRR